MTTSRESEPSRDRDRDAGATLVVFSPVPEVNIVEHEPVDENAGAAQDWAAWLLVASLLGVSALYWGLNH
jgi:hypothetical protein